MSFGNPLVIALGAAVSVLLIAGLVWWRYRTPAGFDRASDRTLPLYSVSLDQVEAAAPRTTPGSAPVVSTARAPSPTLAPVMPVPVAPMAP